MKHLKIKKTVFALLASFLVSSSALADEGIKIKVFSSYDSSVSEFNIDWLRKISFSNDGITFIYKDGVQDGSPLEQFFAYGDVAKMTFAGLVDGIDNVKTDKNGNIEIAYDGRTIKVSGCDAGQLMVFDIAGRPVIRESVSGESVISTDNLASGVYILKVNNKTFKFNKI